MPESPSVTDYLRLLQRLDRWMDLGRRRHPGVVPCQAGCTACCHRPFDVTAADVELIRVAVDRMPAAERAEVVARGRRLLEAMSALEPAGRRRTTSPTWATGALMR